MKFAPVTVAPETWPPLARMLKYQKRRGIHKGSALPLWRLRQRCHIEHCIWEAETFTALVFEKGF